MATVNCASGYLSVSGVQMTCSMRVAPDASMTRRSNPSAQPEAGGIARKRREEVLIQRVALAVALLSLVHLGLEPAALQGGIGQLAEAVGELDATAIELEALGDAGVVRARFCERRFDCRVLGQKRRATVAELGLNECCQHLGENVGPGVVGARGDAGVLGHGRKPVAVGAVV